MFIFFLFMILGIKTLPLHAMYVAQTYADAKVLSDQEQQLMDLAMHGGDDALGHVQQLIAQGVNVDIHNAYGTPLFLAVNADEPEIVKVLLEAGAHVDRDVQGITPLLQAVTSSSACVPLLLAYGADINAQDAQGNTPLIRAVKQDDVDTVILLLQEQADPLIENNKGLVARDIALSKNNPEITQMIDEYITKRRQRALELIESIRAHDFEWAEMLVESGLDANVQEQRFLKTPLMIAIEEERPDFVELILSVYGVDVNKRDAAGRTAFLIAAIFRNPDIMELLSAVPGINLDMVDYDGLSPIDVL